MITLTNAPQLETERLILRLPQLSDFDAYAAFMASERASFVGGPLERDMSWRNLGHMVGHWVLRGYGLFVITDKLDGRPLGMAGMLNPEGWPEPELGWSLWEVSSEGKGIAREAVEAARAYAYGTLGWTTAISLIAPDNLASAGLARRLGAAPERAWELRGKPVNIWRHPSADRLTDGGVEAYA